MDVGSCFGLGKKIKRKGGIIIKKKKKKKKAHTENLTILEAGGG